jgi:hypothetical protein
MSSEQIGLLDKCDGFNGDPSGPFCLSRGGLVRNLRPAANSPDYPTFSETHVVLEYSRDGERWEEYRVSRAGLRVGDVSAIRTELFAEKPVPAPPAGAVRFVWCYRAGEGFRYTEGKRPETYRSPFWVPTFWHSCHAFDGERQLVGYFSPHYPDWGWRGPDEINGVMDSPRDAGAALRGSH